MTGRKHDPACAAKSSLSGGQYSTYREDAERYRQRKGAQPTNGLTQAEWDALCEQMAQFWDILADRHEQAIREGRCHEFLYGQTAGNDT